MIERDDHQIDEEMILIDEVSDEAVEAAAFVALGGLPTLMYRTYCFACPSDPLRDRAIVRSDRAKLIEGHAIRDEQGIVDKLCVQRYFKTITSRLRSVL